MEILKTVVGSFPPKNLPLADAIKWAVDVQLAHGLDIVSDGEQRTDMIGYFNSLPGLGMKTKGPYVKSKVMPLKELDRFSKLADSQLAKDYLKKKGKDNVKLKISITGPVTLGFACACNGLEYYSGIRDTKLYYDFAYALKPIIEAIAKTGCYVQIDEPSLSIRVMDAQQEVKIVNNAISDLPATVRKEERLIVHICGPLTPALFSDFMRIDAPILSLAFSAPTVRKNFEIISEQALQNYGKKLGVGCVSVQATKEEEVEKLDVVVQRLKAIAEKIGKENIALLHPECGLRNTGEDAVDPILDVLARSAKRLEQMD